MDTRIISEAAILAAMMLSFACTKEEGRGGKGADGPNIVNSVQKELTMSHIMELNRTASTINSHAEECGRSHLAFIPDSYVQVGQEAGVKWPSYPRMLRIGNGDYMLMWQSDGVGGGNGRDTYYALSSDLKEWKGMGKLFESRSVRTYLGTTATQKHTNANAIVLSDGRIMAVSSFYTLDVYSKSGVDKDDNYTLTDGTKDQGIRIRFSSDNGKTWTPEQVIYNGPNWECHLMETPEGQIQCYFSESRPKISGSHSGTSLVVSDDGGKTWTPGPGKKPYRVMRKLWADASNIGGIHEKFTYQMPVGIRLNGTDRMAFSMECCSNSISALKHYVSVVYSPESGEWRHLEGNEIGPTGENLENFVQAAAPYLVQFPSGETVLSYCSSGVKYRMGDAMAGNFGAEYTMLPTSGSWAGMCNDTDHTVIAVDRNAKVSADAATIAVGRFWLNHSISATRRTVNADASSEEWEPADDALYVGSVSQANAVVRVSADAENIYFLVEHRDNNLSSSDHMAILLSPETASGRLDGTARRIYFNATGIKSVGMYAGGWRPVDSGVTGAVAYDGTIGDKFDTDNGYVAEIVLPRKDIAIKDGRLLLNVLLFDSVAAEEDAIVNSASTKTEEWLYVRGL